MRRLALWATVLTAVLLLAAPAAAMETGPGSGVEFGAHVSEMARAGHFSGDHNPGMHRGFSGLR